MTAIVEIHRESLEQIQHHQGEIARLQEKIKLLERSDLAFTLSQAKLAYFHGEALRRIGTGHQRKPDYLGYSPTDLVLGEWKSTFEPPTTGSWRAVRPSDPAPFTQIRQQVATWEKNGLPRDVGGHIIIIQGQLADYAGQIGKSYELPWPATPTKLAYTVPLGQKANVESAFREIESRLRIRYDIEAHEGEITVTFVFQKRLNQR
jgi:hypothetical protein